MGSRLQDSHGWEEEEKKCDKKIPVAKKTIVSEKFVWRSVFARWISRQSHKYIVHSIGDHATCSIEGYFCFERLYKCGLERFFPPIAMYGAWARNLYKNCWQYVHKGFLLTAIMLKEMGGNVVFSSSTFRLLRSGCCCAQKKMQI